MKRPDQMDDLRDMGRRERREAEPTDDWEPLLPLLEWPEQQAYEELRPLVLPRLPADEQRRRRSGGVRRVRCARPLRAAHRGLTRLEEL
jgi:hypothetical protein